MSNEDEKPINSTRAMFGVTITCMCCDAKLTGKAYLIDECQKCGRKKQERRRQLAGLRGAQEVGRRMAQEHERRVFEILLGEGTDGAKS